MKKFRISNYMILFITVLGLLIVISLAATVKLNDKHEARLIYAVETKVEYLAKRCYLEGNCNGSITLQTLYDLGYSNKIIHPITKEEIDSSKVITFVDGEYDFKLN